MHERVNQSPTARYCLMARDIQQWSLSSTCCSKRLGYRCLALWGLRYNIPVPPAAWEPLQHWLAFMLVDLYASYITIRLADRCPWIRRAVVPSTKQKHFQRAPSLFWVELSESRGQEANSAARAAGMETLARVCSAMLIHLKRNLTRFSHSNIRAEALECRHQKRWVAATFQFLQGAHFVNA